jgi:hypothetical protein
MAYSRNEFQDLFSVGVEVKIPIPDKDGETLDFFMRKLTPGQQERAMRQANAARIRLSKLWEMDDNDDDKIILLDEIDQVGDHDDKLRFLADTDVAGDFAAMEQELSEEDKWSDDGRIQALTDAWTEEMQTEFAESAPGECSDECQAIFDGIKEFSTELDNIVKKERENREATLSSLSEEAIYRKLFDVLTEHRASQEWLAVFRNNQILHGTLDLESRKKVFDNLGQVDDMPLEIYRGLLEGITRMQMSPVEVK